jgi:hypothetical protein
MKCRFLRKIIDEPLSIPEFGMLSLLKQLLNYENKEDAAQSLW